LCTFTFCCLSKIEQPNDLTRNPHFNASKIAIVRYPNREDREDFSRYEEGPERRIIYALKYLSNIQNFGGSGPSIAQTG
jgi:hypothetical protein